MHTVSRAERSLVRLKAWRRLECWSTDREEVAQTQQDIGSQRGTARDVLLLLLIVPIILRLERV